MEMFSLGVERVELATAPFLLRTSQRSVSARAGLRSSCQWSVVSNASFLEFLLCLAAGLEPWAGVLNSWMLPR